MDSAEQSVDVERRPGHVRVRLQRPDARNTLRPAVTDALHNALTEAEQDPECRLFVISSTGADFCAGMDLSWAELPAAWRDGGEVSYTSLLGRLYESPLVTAAVLEGPATGGGVGLAAACDLAFAAPTVSFRLTELFLGLLPGIIFPCVARRIGQHRAFRMALLAESIHADEALRVGLVDVIAEHPEELVRSTLLALRRTNRRTVSELKVSQQLLFAHEDRRYGMYAGRLLGRSLDDPEVIERIRRWRSEGMTR